MDGVEDITGAAAVLGAIPSLVALLRNHSDVGKADAVKALGNLERRGQ